MTGRVHFIVALDCEAQPLVEYFHLKPDNEFALFRNFSGESISLTVSGIGSTNAACAVVETHSRYPGNKHIWINVGIAGHRSYQRGNAYLIGKLQTADQMQTWYPQILFNAPFDITELTTVDQPSSEYTEQLCDMEAAGFYSLAHRCSLLEFVHCIKIVSDNRNNHMDTINKPLVRRLIEAKLDKIAVCVNALRKLQNELISVDNQDLLDAITAQSHFSAYQRKQLEKILLRWRVLAADTAPADIINGAGDANQILTILTDFLDEQLPDYGRPA